ncbi:MAG: hypothetical protein H6Q14_1078 [Bacteroidetes bacterium]|jgi:hypothetical protein|nr:hypothetical protein [Bacteroidota bacterium]
MSLLKWHPSLFCAEYGYSMLGSNEGHFPATSVVDGANRTVASSA